MASNNVLQQAGETVQRILFVILYTMLLTTQVAAADESSLARETQNPVSDLISLPIQYNISPRTNFHYAPSHSILVQPVVPFSISENWNLVTRTILPFLSLPNELTGDGRKNGIGDISITSLLSPKKISNSTFWGLGSIIQLPSSSERALGSGKWGAGPAGVLGYFGQKVVAGILVSNTWTFGGSNYTKQENKLYGQVFFNYNFPKGWYAVSSPTITGNWRASGQKFIVPVGGGIGKVIKIGGLPINLQFQAFYNAIAPDEAGDYSARFQIQFLFPE